MADDYEQGLSTTMATQSINETEPDGASSSAVKAASPPLLHFPGETEPGDLLTEAGDGGEDGDGVEWVLEVEEKRRARGEKKRNTIVILLQKC